ncbi:diaminopimelate epimerase [uncultured Bdellovibrio sp.]|uniref:diaminopimelate epimerase n=1 Tax=Bdellovibrio sp. HCB-162 TaxID=3394234 RepID=UPI0025CED7EF|nr:diaminopimelate epimerase [uncultured Bdellovibrio sp.]
MKNFLPVTITKMSGAGNTFSLIDARKGSAWEDIEKHLGMTRANFAKLVCDRVLGVSTDGLLLIQSGGDGFDFVWDFYNNDGSTAEMCGNAARCAARFCYENLESSNPEKSTLKFKTGAGLVTAQILGDGKIRVRMPEARFIQERIELKTKSSSTEEFALVNTGVPHLVQKIHNIADATSLKEMAREARSHHDLRPSGANVTFYAEDSRGKIKAVTFERGVEDYTLACGTGAVAAALVYAKETSEKQVEVQMPGGLMQVVFLEGDSHPLMIGDAVFVGEFKYNLEVVG